MKIRIIAPIKHDGVDKAAGDVLDVTDAAAKRLIALGFAESPTRKGKNAKVPEPEPSAPEVTEPEDDEPDGNEPEDDDPDVDEIAEGEGEDMDVDAMAKDAIAQELSIRGIGYKSNATHAQLAALLKDAIGKKG